MLVVILTSFHSLHSSSSSRLGLCLLLLLGRLLLLLFLLFELGFVLSLQAGLFLSSPSDGLEETLESTLLCTLETLGETGCSALDSVFTEALFFDEELDQAFDIGCFPLELALGIVGGTDVGLLEENFCIGPWPVIGNGVLLVLFEELDCGLEALVLLDQVVGDLWANALDGVNVVAAE